MIKKERFKKAIKNTLKTHKTDLERLVEQGGICLLADYGDDTSGFKDTFRAFRSHKQVDPLVRYCCSLGLAFKAEMIVSFRINDYLVSFIMKIMTIN